VDTGSYVPVGLLLEAGVQPGEGYVITARISRDSGGCFSARRSIIVAMGCVGHYARPGIDEWRHGPVVVSRSYTRCITGYI
jgi:hypothetical protein